MQKLKMQYAASEILHNLLHIEVEMKMSGFISPNPKLSVIIIINRHFDIMENDVSRQNTNISQFHILKRETFNHFFCNLVNY